MLQPPTIDIGSFISVFTINGLSLTILLCFTLLIGLSRQCTPDSDAFLEMKLSKLTSSGQQSNLLKFEKRSRIVQRTSFRKMKRRVAWKNAQGRRWEEGVWSTERQWTWDGGSYRCKSEFILHFILAYPRMLIFVECHVLETVRWPIHRLPLGIWRRNGIAVNRFWELMNMMDFDTDKACEMTIEIYKMCLNSDGEEEESSDDPPSASESRLCHMPTRQVCFPTECRMFK